VEPLNWLINFKGEKMAKRKTIIEQIGCSTCIYRAQSKGGGCIKIGMSRDEINADKLIETINYGGVYLSVNGCPMRSVLKEKPASKSWMVVSQDYFLHLGKKKYDYVLVPVVEDEGWIKKVSRDMTDQHIAHREDTSGPQNLLVVSNEAVERGLFG
jgi:hypothetical protein